MPYLDREQARAAKAKWARENRHKSKARRDDLCARVRAYKQERGCQRCGYNKTAVALDLHHPNGKDGKQSGIAQLVRRGFAWEKIRQAIDECQVLCANCHREEHDTTRNY